MAIEKYEPNLGDKIKVTIVLEGVVVPVGDGSYGIQTDHGTYSYFPQASDVKIEKLDG